MTPLRVAIAFGPVVALYTYGLWKLPHRNEAARFFYAVGAAILWLAILTAVRGVEVWSVSRVTGIRH